MTPEEKAKRYEEALERAKTIYKCSSLYNVEDALVSIFPELKESEDEKIRKWIINEIKIKHHNLDEDNVDFVDKAIAWLERHGKQKSIWHDVSEMPIGAYDEEILVQFADFHSSVLLIDDWKYLDHIVRWAYLKDLKEE